MPNPTFQGSACASCGAVAPRAVDAPNLLLQPTLDPVACPLPRPVAGIKRG